MQKTMMLLNTIVYRFTPVRRITSQLFTCDTGQRFVSAALMIAVGVIRLPLSALPQMRLVYDLPWEKITEVLP